MAGVTRHQLSNGLTVILKEQHSAPVVSWWVMYRIGSRNEPTGLTGISHWVEHMMFKGTPSFPGGILDRQISREGGNWNAQTSMDYTAYHETMPADRIDLGMRLEADRMTNTIFEPDEVESERTVIISERQGGENSPMFWLGEEVRAAAFRVHGYHHEIIGDETDLRTMTRDDLYGHYKHHYMPNNAIAVAVGDFQTESMLKRVEELYGSIPAGEKPNLFVRPEPEQRGERRVMVERPGNTQFLEVAYHVPPATDDDWFKLAILNSVLTGPSGMGGGGIDNKTSRLYKAIVETELAVDIDGGLLPSIDPYLFDLVATVRDGRTIQEVETALDVQIDRMLNENITQKELDKARKQARALFAYGTERVSSQAFWLAFAENFHSYEWFLNYVDKLEAVTIDDVRTVAQKYLRPQNRTVGWFVPTEPDGMDMGEEHEE